MKRYEEKCKKCDGKGIVSKINSVADIGNYYIELLRERGEEVVMPQYTKPFGIIDACAKNETIPHAGIPLPWKKKFVEVKDIDPKDVEFELYGNMGYYSAGPYKWEELGLSNSACWYEWEEERKTAKTCQCCGQEIKK